MRFRLFALLLAVGIAAPALAAEFDQILGDLERFEEDLQWQIDAEVQALGDHEFQEMEELFFPVDDDVVRLESERNGVQTSPYVTVRIDGIPVSFSDVPSSAWFAQYVRRSAEDGIVSGYRDTNGRLIGIFGPGDNVTVEQLAKMSLEAAGIEFQNCYGTPKNATAIDSWSASYISCAEELGWVVFSDGSVDVKRSATRSEVVVTLVQAFSVELTRGTGKVFKDVTASTQFSGPIERAAAVGIVSGYTDESGQVTGYFGPNDNVNRAEVAKMVTLAKQVYGQPS